MYQYITAVTSGITGLCGLLRGNILSGNILARFSRKNEQKSYLGVIFLGLACTSSLLLLLISLESIFYSVPAIELDCVGIITAISALIMVGVLVKYELLNKRKMILDNELKRVKKENKIFEHKVSDLATHSDIARAAASSKTFGCFMGSIARLLRTDKAAQELTVFTYTEGQFFPHMYYQFSDFSELCLSFTQKDLLSYSRNIDYNISYDSQLFSAGNLILEYIDGNITIEGGLMLDKYSVGQLRITLFECTEMTQSFGDLLEGIVQNALSSVKIELDGVFKAMGYDRPVLTEVSNSLGILMLRLQIEENILGVVKLQFQNNSSNSIIRQKVILQDASTHISKALYNQKLYEFAVRDGLTGLYNKRYFMEILDTNCRDYLIGDGQLSLMLLDIDYFKKVNDTWGHLAGDEVLKKVAAIVAETARESDITARYGGEELAVIMPKTEVDGAETLAERIRTRIEKEEFQAGKGKRFFVTASFGVAEMENGMMSTTELIEAADKSLYLAKNNGRNQVVVSGNSKISLSAA